MARGQSVMWIWLYCNSWCEKLRSHCNWLVWFELSPFFWHFIIKLSVWTWWWIRKRNLLRLIDNNKVIFIIMMIIKKTNKNVVKCAHFPNLRMSWSQRRHPNFFRLKYKSFSDCICVSVKSIWYLSLISHLIDAKCWVNDALLIQV